MKADKILVPTDFSPTSEHALRYATALARDMKSKLLIVHVEEPPVAYGGGELYAGMEVVDREELLARLKAVVPADENVAYEHHLLAGEPATELVTLAEEEGADLIVMSTHGRTGLMRLVMGSVAEAVVRSRGLPRLHLATSGRRLKRSFGRERNS